MGARWNKVSINGGKKLYPIDNVGDTKKVEDDLKTIYDVQIIGMSNLERYKAYGVQSMS